MNLKFKNEKKNRMEEEICSLWESLSRYLVYGLLWLDNSYIHKLSTIHESWYDCMGTKYVLFGLAYYINMWLENFCNIVKR